MMRFEGKAVLITGGAGSIGWAAAQRFMAEGARVAIADLNGTRAADLVANREGAIAIEADVGSTAGAELAVQRTQEAFGGLDCVFNNAGISGPVRPLFELEPDEWDRVIRTNLRSAFLILRCSIRAMIAGGRGGAIVNMSSSMAGWDVLSGGAGYIASKHAITGLTRSAALDAAGYGIRVNAICPGVIETPLGVPAGDRDSYIESVGKFADRIPSRRIGKPEDVAAVVAFLASDEAAHVTGADWLIDGGQTLQSWANAPGGSAFPWHLRPD
ncbi:SDR family NAD(P)-dependent oxidoreductase [Rhodalgimonas zhirmunskyi]|uniref:SDR family oxidoreductase n=1 Tax=Rhodalgimonas zhirmunskyi TaxID=2964767 RepID=A0AAJ1UCX9_9RHOB|nr:SDR family NAD(P)-dependent oxidoreductase [Rhodoalgimonas zhirmunskyi]MDQ2093597.1 SDR family oxidoreductase [Rhodoalgimonas zhirmunskyi]